MCLIMQINPGGAPLSQAEFDDVAKRNPDGFTVIGGMDGALLYRGLDPVKAWTALQSCPTGVVLHWRKRTSGPIDESRCHGWRVGSVRFLHNGVMSLPIDEGHSDTTTLVRRMARMKIDPLSEDGQWFLARFSSNQVFVLVGLTGGTEWLGNKPFEHRGRLYSNRYAWTDDVHGIERPPMAQIGFRYAGWDSYDSPNVSGGPGETADVIAERKYEAWLRLFADGPGQHVTVTGAHSGRGRKRERS